MMILFDFRLVFPKKPRILELQWANEWLNYTRRRGIRP